MCFESNFNYQLLRLKRGFFNFYMKRPLKIPDEVYKLKYMIFIQKVSQKSVSIIRHQTRKKLHLEDVTLKLFML